MSKLYIVPTPIGNLDTTVRTRCQFVSSLDTTVRTCCQFE
jgi:16S rRNA C1402 (ribose-2'-O) methylase RsmI